MKITKTLLFLMVIAIFVLMNCGNKRCITGDKTNPAPISPVGFNAVCFDSKCQLASYTNAIRDKSGDIDYVTFSGGVCVFDADNCKSSTNPANATDLSQKRTLEDGSCVDW